MFWPTNILRIGAMLGPAMPKAKSARVGRILPQLVVSGPTFLVSAPMLAAELDESQANFGRTRATHLTEIPGQCRGSQAKAGLWSSLADVGPKLAEHWGRERVSRSPAPVLAGIPGRCLTMACDVDLAEVGPKLGHGWPCLEQRAHSLNRLPPIALKLCNSGTFRKTPRWREALQAPSSVRPMPA